MGGSLHFNRLLGVGLCAVLAGACGDGEKPKDGKGQDQEGAAGDSGAKSDGSSDEDGGAKPQPVDGSHEDRDAAPEQPATDAAQTEEDGDAGQSDSDAGEPAKTPGTLLNLPSGGNELSVCYAPGECNGDDLTCYGADGTAPGFCTEDCKQDTDCAAIQGIAATCSSEGQCRLDCTGTGPGDGPCPTNMECRDISNVLPGTGLVASYRCVYPVDAGTNTAKQYEKCDRKHGSGDCQGELSCHTPTVPLITPTGPGYCTEGCEKAEDCKLPKGTQAVSVCTEGACEIDCGGVGATCPQGMNCRDVDSSPISEVWRCRFID